MSTPTPGDRAPGARTGTRARREALMRLVRAGVERVEDLADRSGVSLSTVRRDLSALEAEGRISRRYGGATTAIPFKEQSLGERMALNTNAKRSIAEAAADLVPENSTIFLDAGSTTAELAEHLRARTGISVVTRGLEIAILLAGEPGLEVTVIGGRLNAQSHGTVGPLADEALRHISFDVAFLGADSVDPVDGLGEPTLEETFLKSLVARRSHRVVVLADSSKLHGGAVPAWAGLGEGWTLVTDTGSPEELDAYRENGIVLVTVEASAEG